MAGKSSPVANERQKQLIQAYGVSAFTSRHPIVRELRKRGHEPSIHGNKVWRSSYALMDWFRRNPPPAGARVLDIGCGWGLTGIYLAKRFGCRVTGIDADGAVAPYLFAQAEFNGVELAFRRCRFQQITRADFNGVHTVTGADICFWDELTGPLYNMIRRALAAGVQQVLVADPGRQPFFDLAARCEQDFRCRLVSRKLRQPAPSTKHILLVEPG